MGIRVTFYLQQSGLASDRRYNMSVTREGGVIFRPDADLVQELNKNGVPSAPRYSKYSNSQIIECGQSCFLS